MATVLPNFSLDANLEPAVPTMIEQCHPGLPDTMKVVQQDAHLKQWQKQNFNSRHKHLPNLPIGTTVFLPYSQVSEQVISSPMHHSYIVSTSSGDFCQNRCCLNQLLSPRPALSLDTVVSDSMGSTPPSASPDTPQLATDQHPKLPLPVNSSGKVVTWGGRVSRPPLQLIYGRNKAVRKKEKKLLPSNNGNLLSNNWIAHYDISFFCCTVHVFFKSLSFAPGRGDVVLCVMLLVLSVLYLNVSIH